MTRKRDVQRRFLLKNGWWFNFGNYKWNNYCFDPFPVYNLDRESAFKLELENNPRSVRRRLKKRIAECQ